MKKVFIIFLVGLVFILGCKPNVGLVRLKEGRYESITGGNLVVDSDKIWFYLKGNNGEIILNKKYKYQVYTDGRIVPHTMSSSEYIQGIGQFNWYLEGGKVIQKDRTQTNIISVFTLTEN